MRIEAPCYNYCHIGRHTWVLAITQINEDGRWKKIDAVEYNLTIWVLFCEHTEPSISHHYCLLCNALLIMKRMDGGVSNLQIEVGQ